jgi:hypothetical protein
MIVFNEFVFPVHFFVVRFVHKTRAHGYIMHVEGGNQL